MQLIVYDPHLFLKAWVRLLQSQAMEARKTVNNRISHTVTKASEFVASRERLAKASEELVRAQRRQRNRAKGVPLTEDYEVLDPLSPAPAELTDAEALLLKKAYKLAAGSLHPDKGGTAEAFQALQEAYRAKDLKAVQEMFLLQQKSILEQVAYWKTEKLKPDIQWQQFKQTPAYQIVSHLNRGGDPDFLEGRVLAFFVEKTTMLQLQELNFQAFEDAKEFEGEE